MENETNAYHNRTSTERRDFVKKGLIAAVTGAAALSFIWGCKDKDISVWIANSHLAISPSLIGRWKLADGAPG